MSDYTKIVPAISALDRTMEAAAAAPLDDCMPGGAAGIAAVTDALGALALEMALSPLSPEEAATFASWTGQDVQSQALEGPLSFCPSVMAGTAARPEEARELRASLSEMVRAGEALRLFQLGAKSGARFVQGLLSFACLRLVDVIEAGAGGSAEEQAALLRDTAALRARVRALRDRQEAARLRTEARLEPLVQATAAAEADLRAQATREAVSRGERPADEAVLAAAALLGPAEKSEAEEAKERRRKRR